MRISVKSRYGLSAMICLSQNYDAAACTTVISMAERLKISKIYLEQVFSLLKRASLVISTKGAQGGYQLVRPPKNISAVEILCAIETSLFEKTESTVLENSPAIEKAMQDLVFTRLDDCIKETLSNISLADLATEAEKQASQENYMYYL